MIGKAYVSTFQYYDNQTHKMSFKKRPVLIIGQSDESDYIVLPISRVTNQKNLNKYYDIKISPKDFPLMNLTNDSYIRTHKQCPIHKGNLIKCIVDFKNTYTDTYKIAIEKVEEFQDNLIKKA